jgi:hypothetical protein
MLPQAPPPVLLLDRGYARVALFRLLDQLKVHYVVRVKKNVWVQHPERVAKLVLGMVVLYHALTLIGAEVQKRGLRTKICKDRVSLVFLALRALMMPWLMTYERTIQALFHSRWSLGYETG